MSISSLSFQPSRQRNWKMFETFSFEFRNKFCMNKSPVSGLFLNPFFGDYYCLYAMFSILSHIYVGTCLKVRLHFQIHVNDLSPLKMMTTSSPPPSASAQKLILWTHSFSRVSYVNRIKFISFSFYSLPPESPPPTWNSFLWINNCVPLPRRRFSLEARIKLNFPLLFL